MIDDRGQGHRKKPAVESHGTGPAWREDLVGRVVVRLWMLPRLHRRYGPCPPHLPQPADLCACARLWVPPLVVAEEPRNQAAPATCATHRISSFAYLDEGVSYVFKSRGFVMSRCLDQYHRGLDTTSDTNFPSLWTLFGILRELPA